jgi:hypothetical protein
MGRVVRGDIRAPVHVRVQTAVKALEFAGLGDPINRQAVNPIKSIDSMDAAELDAFITAGFEAMRRKQLRDAAQGAVTIEATNEAGSTVESTAVTVR